jgi:hypothetical protein
VCIYEYLSEIIKIEKIGVTMDYGNSKYSNSRGWVWEHFRISTTRWLLFDEHRPKYILLIKNKLVMMIVRCAWIRKPEERENCTWNL